jgi:hypothetical protein
MVRARSQPKQTTNKRETQIPEFQQLDYDFRALIILLVCAHNWSSCLGKTWTAHIHLILRAFIWQWLTLLRM